MPPDLPPQPIAAQFVIATVSLTVTFDKPLLFNAALNKPNWTLRATALNYTCNAVQSGANQVTGIFAPGIINPGLNVVNYSPPPFDVIGLNGMPVAAFTDFPLTVI